MAENPRGDFKYDLSVVVPVYNKEESLDACITSLLSQGVEAGGIQAVLVNDGSTDGSLAICRKYADRYESVMLVDQVNQGVSAARNAGINAAQGRYLLFLDADDAIGPNTIPNIVKVFDKHYDEVDVVTYPMTYYYPNTGKTQGHKRAEWLTKTGVYDLSETPYIAQSTMNVCVKNRGAENILFNRELKMGEDQYFVTMNLERTAKIGYCHEAEYIYTRDGGGASVRGNNPLYCYDDMIVLYTALLDMGERTPAMKRYAHQLILYNVDWRIKSNLLLPLHLDSNERIASVLRSIPLSEYVDSPYLGDYHKSYLMKEFLLDGFAPTTAYGVDRVTVELPKGLKWAFHVPTVAITHIYRQKGGFHIRGRLVCPSFIFEEKPSFFWQLGNGEKTEVGLFASSFDYSEAKVKTAKCWSFDFFVPCANTSGVQTYRFSAKFPSKEIGAVALYLGGLLRHNARKDYTTLCFKDCGVTFENDALVVSGKRKAPVPNQSGLSVERRLKNLIKRTAVRTFKAFKGSSRVWLYSDLPTSPIESNAIQQLTHDIQVDDGIERYYVSDFEEKVVRDHPELRGRVIKPGSTKHKLYAAQAELFIASYLERYTYMPFAKGTANIMGDLMGEHRQIYLQHGVLHAHLPWYYSYDRLLFDKEVVSTKFEVENLTNNYFFKDKALIKSGMPRFDCYERYEGDEKKIIYIPSWRNHLVSGSGQHRVAIDKTLTNSSFYQGFRKFISLIEESRILEEHDFSLEIKLHPHFLCYEHLFQFESDRISLASNANEDDYCIVICDFSSYVYDFVYLGKKIMYFMPDELEFKAGLNHYWKLDLPMEEAFGPYANTAEGAFENLAKLINECEKGENSADYALAPDDFFLHRDGCNKERLYQALMETAEELRDIRI